MSYGTSKSYDEMSHEINMAINNGSAILPNYPMEIEIALSSGKINEQESALLYNLYRKFKETNKEATDQRITDISKKDRIELVKRRYNEKSALWKFFHKKLNPSKMNLDNMTVEELVDLTHTVMYGEKNGRTK